MATQQKQKSKTSKQTVMSSAKRKNYYAKQFFVTEKNLARKGKTNKKNKQ